MSTDTTEDNDDSLLEAYITPNPNESYSNYSVSDPQFDALVHHSDDLPAEQTIYEMEQVRSASMSKDNIIRILQEQLHTLHRKHKETIDETESIKYKYNHALDELENMKRITSQLQSEVKKYESAFNEPTMKSPLPSDDRLNDPNLQGIAVRIADVKGKVKAVRQIASDTDMPANLQQDIDQMNTEFKNLLRQQYDRIEDILTEHSSILDAIKAKVSATGAGKGSETKIRFSLPSIPAHPVRPAFDLDDEMPHRPSMDAAKINLVAALRQTNDILSEEITDLRRQLEYMKQSLHIGAVEFVDNVLEAAKLNVGPAERYEGHYGDRSQMKTLHEMNNFLRIENKQLKDDLAQQQKVQDEAEEVEALSILHDQMKSRLSTAHDITLVEQELITMKMVIDDLKAEIKDQRQVIRQREDTIDELESELQHLNTKLGQLFIEQTGKQLKFQDAVDSNLRMSSERLDTLKQQINRIYEQKQDAELLLEKTVREKESMTRNMTVLSNTMQQYKNELEVKQAECGKYKERVQRLEDQSRQLNQEMTEKDLQHERQTAKNKAIISEMEGKYKTSRQEMEELRETGQTLMTLKGQNEQLVDEVEQLSIELEKFKGFESKDQLEMDRQMKKLQSFCKKLEEKLEHTKAEINSAASKKQGEIKQHLKEKAILETQTAVLRDEIVKQREGSKNLIMDIDNYKSVINDLGKTILDMKRELNQHNNVNSRPSYDSEHFIQENNCLKEEMREKNCEINNLRLTLDEYNRCRPAAIQTCQHGICSANQTQVPSSCQQSVCPMKQLRRLTDDMKNTQSKISSIVNSHQEFAHLVQHQRHGCEQRAATAAAVGKLDGLKSRVENLTQKEQELQYLLNELQRQNNMLIEFNNKRHGDDIETRLAQLKMAREEDAPTARNMKQAQNDLSRRNRVNGNSSYPNDESVPLKMNHQAPPTKNGPREAVASDPVFNTYQKQLKEAVTKYKHVDQLDAGPSPVGIELANSSTSPAEETSDPPEGHAVIRVDSVATTRSHRERRRTLPLIVPINANVKPHRPNKVLIKKYHDAVLQYNDTPKTGGEDAEVGPAMFQRLQSPIPIYSKELERRNFEPLQFNTFYAKVPAMMYTHRMKRKLSVTAEYNYGDPVISGGPLNCPYKLWQVHFHWGDNDDVGSEHTVNDKRFIMEMHAVHIKEGATLSEATSDPEGFATITYLYTYSASGEDDIAMSSIILNFQRFDLRPNDTMLELQSYFPLDLLIKPFHSQYVTYRGSRTDGSNSENVIWIIAPFTNQISRPQMDELRELKSQLGTSNVRPIQSPNNRIVIFAEVAEEKGKRRPNSVTADNIFLPIKGP